MFDEMRETSLLACFVTRTRTDVNADADRPGVRHSLRENAKAVRQRRTLVQANPPSCLTEASRQDPPHLAHSIGGPESRSNTCRLRHRLALISTDSVRPVGGGATSPGATICGIIMVPSEPAM